VINDLTNDGVGFGTLDAQGKKYESQIDKVKQDIVDGKIKNIPDTVK
jgi:hypothetical protein